jgi:hypothetical protein
VGGRVEQWAWSLLEALLNINQHGRGQKRASGLRSACHLVTVEKRKCCRHATALGAVNGLSSGTRDCNRGIVFPTRRIDVYEQLRTATNKGTEVLGGL